MIQNSRKKDKQEGAWQGQKFAMDKRGRKEKSTFMDKSERIKKIGTERSNEKREMFEGRRLGWEEQR